MGPVLTTTLGPECPLSSYLPAGSCSSGPITGLLPPFSCCPKGWALLPLLVPAGSNKNPPGPSPSPGSTWPGTSSPGQCYKSPPASRGPLSHSGQRVPSTAQELPLSPDPDGSGWEEGVAKECRQGLWGRCPTPGGTPGHLLPKRATAISASHMPSGGGSRGPAPPAAPPSAVPQAWSGKGTRRPTAPSPSFREEAGNGGPESTRPTAGYPGHDAVSQGLSQAKEPGKPRGRGPPGADDRRLLQTTVRDGGQAGGDSLFSQPGPRDVTDHISAMLDLTSARQWPCPHCSLSF